jgi:hypothetical protein
MILIKDQNPEGVPQIIQTPAQPLQGWVMHNFKGHP